MARATARAITGSLDAWGERLSDRIRAALDRKDLAGARRLALEGDGEARNLEKEYTLMYKGLGITLRILLDLLGETLARHQDPSARARAAAALVDLLRRFQRDLTGLLAAAYTAAVAREALEAAPGLPVAPTQGTVERELADTARLLVEAETLFAREQARLAREVVRALEAERAAEARALVDRKERGQYVPIHDRLIRFMAGVFGYVLTELGPDGLLRFHRETAERQREGFEKWERLDAREFVRATAFLLKQHMGRLEVHEDPEKFTLVQTPCGSGGGLRLAGAYDGRDALPFVVGRGPLTAGQERLPVYCTHCPIWNSVAPVEWFGRAQWVFEDPSRPDGSCTLHIDKRRDAVPADSSRQLGLAGHGGSG